ncbi:hypothetical protein GCM10020255_089520 [Rhodococcus baikonurensis]
MHTHMSLFEGDTNAFHNPDDPMQLSETGKAFIAGILEHANEISAVTNQWVNSYKRLVHGERHPQLRRGARPTDRLSSAFRCTRPTRRRHVASRSEAQTRPATRT